MSQYLTIANEELDGLVSYLLSDNELPPSLCPIVLKLQANLSRWKRFMEDFVRRLTPALETRDLAVKVSSAFPCFEAYISQ
jgi:hypothetical protein